MDEGQRLIMEDEKKLHVFSEDDFECTVEVAKDESNDERELDSLKFAAAHVAKTTSFSATEAGDALVECAKAEMNPQLAARWILELATSLSNTGESLSEVVRILLARIHQP